jgi:FMN phosphatase YigB (HAD superfamily)
MKRFIALDIGDVICKVVPDPFIESLSETFNVTVPEATRFLKRFQRIHDLGFTTMEDELKDKFGAKSPKTIKKLVSEWNASITPDTIFIDKLNNLKQYYDLNIALLSNIGVEHAQMMEDSLGDKFLDGTIRHFSCFVGARKPSALFYQSFLMQYPEFTGSLYVDDLQENLDASKRFGFKTFRMSLVEPGCDDKINDIEQIILGRPYN